MKFGVEFNSRSVSRWKNYNIDYNLLKSYIKEATTEFDDNSSSDNSTALLTEHQKKLLKKLYKNFKDQIDFVSLFVFSKVGEISRRLATLKRQCNMFVESENDRSQANISDVSLRLRKRKLMLFHKELDSITKELQDLSRFLLLQKIAVKKLLKKFVKYSSFSKKQEFVTKITDKCLLENQKSFVHLNLNDLALETTLLYDFLDTFLSQSKATPHPTPTSNTHINSTLPPKNNLLAPPKIRERQSSIHTIDSLQLTTQSYSFHKSKVLDENLQIFPRSTTFDIVSKRKGPRSLTFWIHKDNLDEVKFLLSSEFKLITDDSLFTKDVKLKSTRSSLNLRESDNSSEENLTSGSSKDKLQTAPKHDEFCPETDTISIWLNNPSNFMFVETSSAEDLGYEASSPDTLNIFKANPYSQILVSNANASLDDQSNNPILITPIGGLRQFSIASLNKNLVDSLFNNSTDESILSEEKKKLLFSSWLSSNLQGNTQMTQLTFDWVIDNNVKPLASISSKKLRFINLNDSDKIDFYISLDWDIKIHQSNVDGSEDLNTEEFPHAILELNFDIAESEFPLNIKSLINSYLVYRTDTLNFSLNNYLIYLYINKMKEATISDDEMLLFIAPWHNTIDKDIRSLPEMRSKSQPCIDMSLTGSKDSENDNNNAATQSSGILLNKDEVVPRKAGYWNEFDNGSDFGGGDEGDGFYVYIDNENNHNKGLFNWFTNLFVDRDSPDSGFPEEDLESNYNTGLEWLSNDKIGRILKWADHTMEISNKIKDSIFGIDAEDELLTNEHRSLLRRNTRNYSFGAISYDYNADEEEESDSEMEAMMSLPHKNHRSEAHTVISKENHDRCLSFLYLIMPIFSLLTSSIGSFIVYTAFHGDSKLGKPQLTTGLMVLVGFAIFCLILSSILTGFSICLLILRYTDAPLWHFAVVWCSAILSTVFFFHGILTCF